MMLRLSKSSYKQFASRKRAQYKEVSTLPKASKRRRTSCSKQDGESRDGHPLVDQISMLPDELLLLIMSRLTLKQAVATSVLSSRWRRLWTFTTRLDFDGTKFLMKNVMALRRHASILKETRLKYVRWVKHVLELRKDSIGPIEFFKIDFDLTKRHERYINEWVRYALERKVQVLELDFNDNAITRGSRLEHKYYTFPFKFLSRDAGDCSNYSQPWSLRHCNSIYFKHLKKLRLNYVNVDAEGVEFFLHNCPLLEDLSIRKSAKLYTLKITGPFPSLRCLEICLCHNLRSVEIRDLNLVCLKYTEYAGTRIHFLLKDVPLLVNLTAEIHGKNDILIYVIQLFSSILPQLETFKIIANTISSEGTQTLYSKVELSNLKELVVNVSQAEHDSFLPLANLIRASPFLQRFVLEATHKSDNFGANLIRASAFLQRSVLKATQKSDNFGAIYGRGWGKPYTHLKEVTFVGYRGTVSDPELILHFVDNAVALEKIVINPSRDSLLSIWHHSPFNKESIVENERDARTRAEELRKIVPPRINLEILS